MSNEVDIDSLKPHKVSEVICIMCYARWISVRPSDTKLIDLQCPKCEAKGYTIETGETLKEEE